MSLKKQLGYLKQRNTKRASEATPLPRSRGPVGTDLPGQRVQTPHGDVHLVDAYLEPHHCHGHAPVADALSVCTERLAQLALDPTLEVLDMRRALFLDTETTGLAGGTGTVPFLIGVAWFEDESLRVQQLFLPELGEEAPMLQWLAERMHERPSLVTFNGKTFDWPLLRNRFILNRLAAPPIVRHLDLLHCARRILRPRLGSVRLVELEREVLGMWREDDVSGALIPQLYFDYLDDGETEPIAQVIEHNANDLIALAALVAKLVSHFDDVHAEDDPRDHLAYAKVAERTGDRQRAVSFAEAAAAGGGDADCTVEAWMLAARVARRAGSTDEEERALLEALQAADADEVGAAVRLALAKHYEHRRKDPRQALEHATLTEMAEGQEAAERRVARLRRRLEREERA